MWRFILTTALNQGSTGFNKLHTLTESSQQGRLYISKKQTKEEH